MSLSNRRKFLATTGLASVTALGSYGMTLNENASSAKKSKELLDLTDFPVIDHHHHELSVEAMNNPEPWRFAQMFYHGDWNDGLPAEGKSGMSKLLNYNLSNTGIVLATVAEFSNLFGCEDTLEAVVAERYRRVSANAAEYTKMLYKKARIESIVLDSNRTEGVPPLIPAKIWRLVPNDMIFDECLKECENLATFRTTYLERIANKLSDKQYIGVKSHIGEQFGLFVDDSMVDSQGTYEKAHAKDPEAKKKIYAYSFNELAHYCCEKGVPIHIHTGTTGDLRSVPPLGQTLDPFLLAPYLKRKELRKLKVVLLHGGFPWVEHCAIMAYNFPNVYMDMSWMFPWNVLGLKNLLHDAMSIAPISKIIYGGGCHTGPETAYMGAIVLKKVVTGTLTELMNDQFLTFRQATEAAHMILHRNVETFYNF